MSPTITAQTLVAAQPDHVSCEVGGEAVILDMRTGVYYGLDAVGADAWSLIQERPTTVAEVRDRVLEKYKVEGERCEADLIALFADMHERGLVELPNGER